MKQAESVPSHNASLTRSRTHAPREVDTDDPFLLIADIKCLSPVPEWGAWSLLTFHFRRAGLGY